MHHSGSEFHVSMSLLLKVNFLTSSLNHFLNSLRSCPLIPDLSLKNYITWNVVKTIYNLESFNLVNPIYSDCLHNANGQYDGKVR